VGYEFSESLEAFRGLWEVAKKLVLEDIRFKRLWVIDKVNESSG
jgi:hypothetical protein